jgi:putative flippase GtrA
MRFGSIGVLSTVLHLGLFVVLQRASGATQAANLAALLAATVVNTALNRRWTFGITGANRALRHQLQGLVVFGVTWASSAIALWLLMYVSARPSTIDQGLTVAVAMVISTVVRFVAMRSWMFGSHPGATVQA